MTIERGSKIQVLVERLSVGGRGVARFEGLVLFIDDACPDDLLEVEITKAKKNFAEARITQILKPSPSRIKPPCPVAGICGGCNWQQVAYNEQLRQKRSLVRESLVKFSGYDVKSDDAVATVQPSPNEFRYRNRIQLHHAHGKIGFFKRGSHEIVDIQDCPITETALTDQFAELRKEFRDQRPGRFEIFISEDGRVQRRQPEVDLNETDEGGLAFSQVNTAQNVNLVSRVLELVKKHGTTSKNLFDLYAGSGNFSFPFAQTFPDKKITAVELSADSVRKAQSKVADLEFKNLKFVQSDVADYLQQNRLPAHSFLILDPPRTGCEAPVMEAIANSQNPPEFIVYISCHPVTLARDLHFLREKFALLSVEPFDMFPQTDHVESVVLLERLRHL